LTLAVVHASATAVWPPAGIGLAALLLLGYRVWPGIFLGAFLANITTAGSTATSIGIATGNTLEALVGAYLVTRFAHGSNAFDRAQEVFRFAVAGMLSTTVSATLGVTSLALGGYARWVDYGAIWFTWWLGDVSGALVVAPLVILWSLNPRIRWNHQQMFEAGLLILSLVVVSLIVFGGWLPTRYQNYPVAFVILPLLVWAASRFGQRETATATFLIAGLAIWGGLRGFGPFLTASPNESLLLLGAFTGVAAVTGMALAARSRSCPDGSPTWPPAWQTGDASKRGRAGSTRNWTCAS
jgi:integral membrane sensor domain MASE1